MQCFITGEVHQVVIQARYGPFTGILSDRNPTPEKS